MSRGILSGGFCPGGFCPGGFCPRTVSLTIHESFVLCLKVFSVKILTKVPLGNITIFQCEDRPLDLSQTSPLFEKL